MRFGLNKERAIEILNKYNKGDHALFNWCDEYKNFIDECVLYCVSSKWDYMLKKSYEDEESPISYEDLPFNKFNQEQAIYNIKDSIPTDEEDFKECLKEINEELTTEFKTKEEFFKSLEEYEENDFINLLTISYFTHLNEEDFKTDIEVYEWWLISDPLKYRLEQEEEIFLNGAWGRQATGQHISLDYCCINAFIGMLKDWFNLN